jgi:tRNA threonylcarbamoyladenosine biosynthesis protein TsaE
MGGRSRIVELKSPEETHLFGQHAAQVLPAGSILALHGPLGAGKTSFVQGLALGLEITASIQSPTFTYLNLYEEGLRCLYHFDLYRMKSPSDFFAMGFEEYFNQGGITAIEWPERLGAALPTRVVSLRFSYSGSGRNADLSSAFEPDLINLLASWD